MTDYVIQQIVNALSAGSLYALMAVGIGLVFGVLRLVNFAYGQLIMAGAFTLAYASRANWSTYSGERTVSAMSAGTCRG